MSASFSTEEAYSVALACQALDIGHLVVIPTDTVYGVAARLDRPESMNRLFEVKKRPRSKPLAILVPDMASALELGEFSEEARRMAEEGWPGALTLVVPAVTPMPELGGDGTTVGLRIPALEWTVRLLFESGPLAVTSANPSGMPTAASIADVEADLGSEVALYIDGGRLEAPPSTVISLIGAEPTQLR